MSLAASSVKEGDLLVCARRGGTVGGGGGAGGQNPMAIREDGSLVDPAAALETVRSNAQTMAQLASHQPELHSIIRCRLSPPGAMLQGCTIRLNRKCVRAPS